MVVSRHNGLEDYQMSTGESIDFCWEKNESTHEEAEVIHVICVREHGRVLNTNRVFINVS